MFKSLSTSLIVRGVLALAVGIIALAWPQVTVLALVILFAVYAFIAAGLEAMRAFSSRAAGPVFGHLLLGLVDLAAGVIALVWPGPTALVLVLIVASWAVVTGLFEIVAAFRRSEAAGTRALFILGGLASIAFGVVLFARPGRRRGHPRAAVRPVQPDLRRLGAGPRHRTAPHPAHPGHRRPRAARGLNHAWPRPGLPSGSSPAEPCWRTTARHPGASPPARLPLPGHAPRERPSHEGKGAVEVTTSGLSCPARARASCARLVISSLRKTFTR